MQATTDSTTPEMADVSKTKEEQNNKQSNHQQETKFNKQGVQNNSPTRKHMNKIKCKPLEILGIIFLTIIFNIIICEMARYSIIRFTNLSNDTILYRYQFILYLSASCVCLFAIGLLVICTGGVFSKAMENAVPVCIDYFYVDKRQSYKWWQTKPAISFIVKSIIMMIWTIIVIESSRFMLIDFSLTNIYEDRLIVYRITGIITLIICSIVAFFEVIIGEDALVSYAQTLDRVK